MIPLILSGGSGTRLWPVSRESHPKQFCPIFADSLILQTIRRLEPLGSPWVITTRSMRVLTEGVYRKHGLPTQQILLEPMGRNTAAAIALCCRRLQQLGRGTEVAGIFPADHFVEQPALFHRALRLAEDAAAAGRVVTLGITPTFPATGYGYIELQQNRPYTVEDALRFFEKPALPVAEAFLASGRFVWNAGIFVFRVDVMAAAMARFLPELWGQLLAWDGEETRLPEVYARLPSVSVDVGIMEKLADLACIPCTDLGWNDVGSWDEVANLATGQEAVHLRSRDCFVFSTVGRKSYALVGVEDLRVVDTPDALLIVRKGASQEVKDAQAVLARAGVPAATTHPYRYVDGGRVEDLSPHLPGMKIVLDPGGAYEGESGTYILLSGTPSGWVNGETVGLQKGQSQVLPPGSRMKLQNRSAETAEVLWLRL